MNKLKIIVSIVLTVLVMSYPKIVYAQSEDTKVYLEFDKTSYSQGDTILMTFHVKNYHDLFGFQIDLENQLDQFKISNQVQPYNLSNNFIFTSKDKLWLNTLKQDVATIMYTKNLEAENGYNYQDKTALISIKLIANTNISNMNNLFKLSNNYTDLQYGDANIIIKLSDSSGESISYTFGNNPQPTLPTMRLNGSEVVTLEVGSAYNELGVTVSDGAPYQTSGTVNVNTLGNYIINYFINDNNGDKVVQLSRTVKVVDTTKPQVTLNKSIDTIFVGDSYVDPGVKATDNYDDEVTTQVQNKVNINVAGEYTIIYTVKDSSNNQTILKRYVNVLAKQPIVTFTLKPSKTTLLVNETFVDGGCTVKYNEIEEPCQIASNTVNTNQKGIYEIVYVIQIDGINYYKTRIIFVLEHRNSAMVYYYKEEETII